MLSNAGEPAYFCRREAGICCVAMSAPAKLDCSPGCGSACILLCMDCGGAALLSAHGGQDFGAPTPSHCFASVSVPTTHCAFFLSSTLRMCSYVVRALVR